MLKLLRTLRMAVVALRRNVLRSALTTLGIIIGVAAVIAMMEIGQGSSKAMQQTIARMGANNLLILPGAGASGGVSFGSGSALTLTPQDGEAVARDAMAAAPDRDREPGSAGSPHRLDDIGRAGARDDRRGPPVEDPVERDSCLVVAGVVL